VKAPTPTPNSDWQRLWFSTREQDWSSLALVPGDASVDVGQVAETFAATGRLYGQRSVTVLDGQGVQSAGGIDMNGGGGGRGVEFRQLSADLIKSVDVVKGSTADMTEGSLGGSVIIKTRTALDFRKPFVSIRTAASQSSARIRGARSTAGATSTTF